LLATNANLLTTEENSDQLPIYPFDVNHAERPSEASRAWSRITDLRIEREAEAKAGAEVGVEAEAKRERAETIETLKETTEMIEAEMTEEEMSDPERTEEGMSDPERTEEGTQM